MREISNFFYRTSGIYSRLCRYMAYLYRYDWLLTPYINSNSIREEKILEGFYKALNYLDNFEIKKYLGEVALKVVRNGSYYGYKLPQKDRMIIQELPQKYCRSRFNVNNRPAVEFNMKFFDDMYRDVTQKMKILNLFPKEFKKGYILYKEGKLTPDFQGDTQGWYLLDPKNTIKFNMNGEDFPAFISVIPAIIDLNEAQGLDRKKMQQQILKIIIQKMPLDKNGDPIFDMDEVAELHNNAVRMLGKAIGLDVLTTFADVDVADMADNKTSTTTDELEKVERGIYNEAGVSQMQFNTDGNIALEKSILNDEAAMYNLLAQFEGFLNDILEPFNKYPKKIKYKVQLLTTTIYNYKDMAKLYKEQATAGYSKMLPQIALGQSQSSILANAYFENDILDLVSVFIPLMSSNTMNSESLKNMSDDKGEEKKAGRKELNDDKKSEKTIKNKEAEN
ncbi:MAG: putative portal protein [Caudoviricetes sp.]|nr:MAG: putative portal protein [Caudoviricetes sp.]